MTFIGKLSCFPPFGCADVNFRDLHTCKHSSETSYLTLLRTLFYDYRRNIPNYIICGLSSIFIFKFISLSTYLSPTDTATFCCYFETTSYLSEADLQLLIILLQPPELVSANKSQEPTQK